MDYSTGKWDGDTLVVDTIGFNDQLARPHGSSAQRGASLDGTFSAARRRAPDVEV
jgi:hypothetical protein